MSYSKVVKAHEITLFESHNHGLSFIDIELTERCNNNCIHCYINQPPDKKELKNCELNTAFINNILHQAADAGCLSVRFTGGEPLLREDFTELYFFARKLGMNVILFTNATLISEELCLLFKQIPPGRPIEVSVYGMHSRSYDAVAARRGAFDEFWSGLALLLKHDIPFVIKQSLLPQNRDEIVEFESFASTLPHMHNKPGYSMNFDLRSRRDNPAKNELIKRLRLSPEETLSMLTRNSDEYIEGMRRFVKNFFRPPTDRLFNCGAGHIVSVDAYGNAQMCNLLRHPSTIYSLDPNLHQENHPDSGFSPLVFAFKDFFPQIRQIRANNPEYLRRCAICFLRSLCEQCPAKSWEEHGTLDTPVEYHCQVTHAQARYLGLIDEGEKSWDVPKADWRARLDQFANQV